MVVTPRVNSTEEQVRQACTELERRLRAGQECGAETYLAALPSVEVEQAADLIYAEFLTRLELGQQQLAERFYSRFPHWRHYLQQQFAVHDWLRQSVPPDPPLPRDSSATWKPLATPSPDSASPAKPQALEWPEQYELLGEIARGGMGVVYKARQVGLNRVVALKMLKGQGAPTGDDLARFRAEAEIIARLEHPHIVRIHEIGERHGCPFLALEYVPGGSLAQRLTKGPLPPADAALLVERVAQAVQVAHQNGILHRDLKPGNILLGTKSEITHPQAETNPTGRKSTIKIDMPEVADTASSELEVVSDLVPKLTDFGLAKRLDVVDQHTRTGAVVGTPTYMAPEQVTGQREAIGPGTDVYALGVVLYECLTGRPPFQAAQLLDLFAAIHSQEPVPPTRLQPKIPADLETICLKCLQKEPAKRYGSAQELVDDLARFRQGEPIHARPVSRTERVWRWCKRNPVVAGLVGALSASLLIGFVTVLLLYLHAEERREQAETERGIAQVAQRKEKDAATIAEQRRQQAEKAQQQSEILSADNLAVLDFLMNHLLNAPRPDAQRRHVTLLEAIDAAAPKVTAAYKDRPLVVAALHAHLGETYRALGEYDKAEAHIRASLPLYEQHLGLEHERTVHVLSNLAKLLDEKGRLQDAEALFRRCLDLAQRVPEIPPERLLLIQNNYCVVLEKLGRRTEALPLAEEVYRRRRELLGEDHQDTLASLNNVAMIQQSSGQLVNASRSFQTLLDGLRRTLPADHPQVLIALNNLAGVEFSRREYSAAVQRFREVLEAHRRVYGPDHPQTLNSINNLGTALCSTKQFEEAHQLLAETLPVHERKLGKDHVQTWNVAHNLAGVLRDLGRSAEAEPLLRRAYDGRRSLLGATHRDTLLAEYGLALVLCDVQRYEEAQMLLRRHLINTQKVKDWPPLKLLETGNRLGDCLTHLKRYADAEKILQQVHAEAGKAKRPSVKIQRNVCTHLIRLYEAWNKPAEADKWRQELAKLPPTPTEVRR